METGPSVGSMPGKPFFVGSFVSESTHCVVRGCEGMGHYQPQHTETHLEGVWDGLHSKANPPGQSNDTGSPGSVLGDIGTFGAMLCGGWDVNYSFRNESAFEERDAAA